MSAFPDPAATAPAHHGLTMTGKSDGDLLKLYAASRNEAAFREIVRRHSGVVLAAARRRSSGDHVLAEDAVQQTFILLARNPVKAARAISLAAWLHRAATYEVSNLLRREIRHRTRAAEAAAGEPEFMAPEPPEPWLSALPHLDEALASMNETDRSLLVLHHMEGLSYAEVAQRLRCSTGSAQRRGHRALEKLATRLRHRKINLSLAALASGLGLAVTPNPACAVVAGRALAAGGMAGTGAGLLAGLLSPLALGAAAALVTSTAAFWVVRSRGSIPPAPPVTVAKTVVPDEVVLRRPPAPPVVRQPVFEPEKADDKLTADELAFINLAKSDPAEAMAWAREKFPASNPLFTFLQTAGRALADRDLPAADRLLEIAGVSTRDVFENIFASRLKRDFAEAVRWADEWNLAHPTDPQSPSLYYLNHDTGEWRPDIPRALAASRSKPVRENLIHMECERLTAEDEAGLEILADRLEGEERKRVQEYYLSVLLIRGDARAAEAILAIRPQRLHNTREMALRDPALILDYHMSQDAASGEDPFYQTANNLFVEWEREDPEAAEAWTARYSKDQFFQHHLYGPRKYKLKEGGK